MQWSVLCHSARFSGTCVGLPKQEKKSPTKTEPKLSEYVPRADSERTEVLMEKNISNKFLLFCQDKRKVTMGKSEATQSQHSLLC